MKPVRFVVLGMQRSGTTATAVCLGGHPNVSMANDEVFPAPFFTRGLAAFTGGKESYRERKAGYSGLFDLIAGYNARETTLAAGFRVAVGDRRGAIDVANCLREYLHDVKIISVYRTDVVAQCGSLHRARKSGEWHAWEGEKGRRRHLVEIPPEEFERHAVEAAGVLAQLRSLRETHDLLEFNYEKDILPGDRYQALFDFLGLPRVPVTWLKMEKVAPPPEEYIVDCAALREIQARIVPPGRDEAAADAARRLEEQAEGESPVFLGYRACERLGQGRIDAACRDLLTAFRKRTGGGLDLSLQGHLCGVFSGIPGLERHPEAAEAIARLREEAGRYAHFRLTQADALLLRGRFAAVRLEMVDLLAAGDELDAGGRRQAFDLLIRSLVGLEDLAAAEEAVRRLEPHHPEDAGLLTLKAMVLHHSGYKSQAVSILEAVLAREPGAERARAFLAELGGDRQG